MCNSLIAFNFAHTLSHLDLNTLWCETGQSRWNLSLFLNYAFVTKYTLCRKRVVVCINVNVGC